MGFYARRHEKNVPPSNSLAQVVQGLGREFHSSHGSDCLPWLLFPHCLSFQSEDPLGFKAPDFNLSRYVLNQPTNFTDRSGKNPVAETRLINLRNVIPQLVGESAEAYGVRVHSFLQDLVEILNPLFRREYYLDAYGRADLLNATERIIIEIKPYNPEGIAAGVAQLEVYEVGAQALVKEGTWTLYLWLY